MLGQVLECVERVGVAHCAVGHNCATRCALQQPFDGDFELFARQVVRNGRDGHDLVGYMARGEAVPQAGSDLGPMSAIQ
jgi:hypothetical protein